MWIHFLPTTPRAHHYIYSTYIAVCVRACMRASFHILYFSVGKKYEPWAQRDLDSQVHVLLGTCPQPQDISYCWLRVNTLCIESKVCSFAVRMRWSKTGLISLNLNSSSTSQFIVVVVVTMLTLICNIMIHYHLTFLPPNVPITIFELGVSKHLKF